MNKKANNRTAENAVIINAKPADFMVGTHNRADRLVEAVKPITDEWYVRFRTAMEKGTNNVIIAWMDYSKAVIATKDRQPDEIFRYAALTMILNGIKEDERAGWTMPVSDATKEAINLILGVVEGRVRAEYPLKQFLFHNDLFRLASEIDTLGLEYGRKVRG